MKNNIKSQNIISTKIKIFVLALSLIVVPSLAFAETLERQLSMGMSGSDVTALQTFLSKDPSIYPQGLVTGYFGFLTKAAVSNFQTKNGISSVGRVGPATLPVLNLQMSNGNGVTNNSNLNAPMITSVSTNTSRNTASVSWNTSEASKGWVYYSTSPLSMTEQNNNSVIVNGNVASTDGNLNYNQNVVLQNLLPNTTYYYLVYSINQIGNASLTWPSTFQTSN